MAATTIATAASANGFYPDANGVAGPAASSGLNVGGNFGNAKVVPWISDGTNWIELRDDVIQGPIARRISLGPDQKLRLELRDVTANTSINASID